MKPESAFLNVMEGKQVEILYSPLRGLKQYLLKLQFRPRCRVEILYSPLRGLKLAFNTPKDDAIASKVVEILYSPLRGLKLH